MTTHSHLCEAIDSKVAGRFWKHVSVKEEDQCWEWTGNLYWSGYGRFTLYRGKYVKAHRVAWVLANGPLPDVDGPHGACVCHKCDNRKCCNPAHLFVGSQADNLKDMDAKGRRGYGGRKGSQHPHAKLTEAQVAEIRKMEGISQTAIAKLFGIRQPQVSAIKLRQSWRHVA